MPQITNAETWLLKRRIEFLPSIPCILLTESFKHTEKLKERFSEHPYTHLDSPVKTCLSSSIPSFLEALQSKLQTVGHFNPKHFNKQAGVQYLFMVSLSLPPSLPPCVPSFPSFLPFLPLSFFSLMSLRWNLHVMRYTSPKCLIPRALTNTYSRVTKPPSRPRALLSPHKVPCQSIPSTHPPSTTITVVIF